MYFVESFLLVLRHAGTTKGYALFQSLEEFCTHYVQQAAGIAGIAAMCIVTH